MSDRVREHPLLEQFEKETTMRVDKDDQVVHFYSRIGSHIRTVLKSDNDNIKITKKNRREDSGDIFAIEAEIPLDSITISIKDEPKKTGNLSSMMI